MKLLNSKTVISFGYSDKDIKMIISPRMIIYLLFIISLNSNLFAQGVAVRGEVKPYQIGIFPPLSTNGKEAPEYINKFSYNLLVGYNGGVEGIEIGSFVNINKHDVFGAQFAGFGNFTGGSVTGVQISGFSNLNAGMTSGLQWAGFINGNMDATDLISLSGFMNLCGDMEGIQGAGFMNVAKDANAYQLSGFMNLAEDINGGQASGFANIAKDVKGGQVSGFMNVAQNVKGVQIAGFLNVCDSIDGIPIAFLSVVRKNGYRKFQIGADEVFYANTSFKIGVEKWYTLFSAGIHPGSGQYHWATGIGFGSRSYIKENLALDLEFMSYRMIHDKFWNDLVKDQRENHSLNRINFNFTFNPQGSISYYVGPSINVMVLRGNIDEDNAIPLWNVELWKGYQTKVNGWVGLNAGISF